MSIRAYRVIKMGYAQPNFFNLWHDDKLVNFFDRNYGFLEGMNERGAIRPKCQWKDSGKLWLILSLRLMKTQ
jgi:hypothetical protein